MVVAALSGYPDTFSIVLLSTLGKGQSIAATDSGWQPEAQEFEEQGDAYDPSDSLPVVHTAVDDEPPGTVLTQADFSGGWLNLNGQDQLLIYQGAQSDPTFLCAFDCLGTSGRPTTPARRRHRRVKGTPAMCSRIPQALITTVGGAAVPSAGCRVG